MGPRGLLRYGNNTKIKQEDCKLYTLLFLFKVIGNSGNLN